MNEICILPVAMIIAFSLVLIIGPTPYQVQEMQGYTKFENGFQTPTQIYQREDNGLYGLHEVSSNDLLFKTFGLRSCSISAEDEIISITCAGHRGQFHPLVTRDRTYSECSLCF